MRYEGGRFQGGGVLAWDRQRAEACQAEGGAPHEEVDGDVENFPSRSNSVRAQEA